MEDEPGAEGEGAGYPPPTPPHHVDPPGSEGADPGPPAGSALAEEADEIRRMVDAGAGSPEAIRELAARLREHRAHEEALWRAEVKPALVKENKGRLRGHRVAPRPERAPSHLGTLGVILLGLVVIVLIAANTSGWVLVVPLVALVGWAWSEGRDSTP